MSSWFTVVGRSLTKINELGADQECNVARFVSEDILL